MTKASASYAQDIERAKRSILRVVKKKTPTRKQKWAALRELQRFVMCEAAGVLLAQTEDLSDNRLEAN